MVFIDVVEKQPNGIQIKVIGVGGAGNNAVRHMVEKGLHGVECVCANTDAQVLSRINNARIIQLGVSGLGAGGQPAVGREAAESDSDKIRDMLDGSQMVFITAGMGGGTGTGAAPVIARIAREMGILTVGVVSKPFFFEGSRRASIAQDGILELKENVDSLIVVLNEKLIEVLGEDITQREAFQAADEVLCGAVAGIAEIINCPGEVNVDFEDVKSVMSEMGVAMMGTAVASGPDRAVEAARKAIACPLLEGVNLNGARGLLVNITASQDTLKMNETRKVMNTICEFAASDVNAKFGAVYDETMGEKLRVTVVVTGLGSRQETVVEEEVEEEVVQPVQPMASLFKVHTGTDGRPVDYDEPSFVRRQSRGRPDLSGRDVSTHFEIPSFLRKQAD